MLKRKTNKITVVAVSGGFDPIHIGHVRMMRAAKELGDELVVILNNDNWLKYKRNYIFMPEQERKEIIEALACVDKVVLTNHKPNTKDISICKELEKIRPDIFINGGDRIQKNIPEVATCKKIGCKMVFNVGGEKVQSSSLLLDKYRERSEEHTSELQPHSFISYAVLCWKKKTKKETKPS